MPTSVGSLTPVSTHRPTYSERQGRGPRTEPLPFEDLRALGFSVLDGLWEACFFQQAFGYECVDAGTVYGTIGSDPSAYFLRRLGRKDVWHYRHFGTYYDEDTLLDVVEVLYDLVSAPLQDHGHNHDYNHCGWHYDAFDKPSGQVRMRQELNEVLKLRDPALEVLPSGEIVESAPEGFAPLLTAEFPDGTPDDPVKAKVQTAIRLYQSRHASDDDRLNAVRGLADVLEFLRSSIKAEMLSADENDLFNLANNFAIRHNNDTQKRDYDSATWHRWMFYVYLATIHAVLRVRDRQSPSS
jgi:hypothetical protein